MESLKEMINELADWTVRGFGFAMGVSVFVIFLTHVAKWTG